MLHLLVKQFEQGKKILDCHDRCAIDSIAGVIREEVFKIVQSKGVIEDDIKAARLKKLIEDRYPSDACIDHFNALTKGGDFEVSSETILELIEDMNGKKKTDGAEPVNKTVDDVVVKMDAKSENLKEEAPAKKQ